MNVHRSRFEIYKEFLTQVHNGNCHLTKLMYSINVIWARAEESRYIPRRRMIYESVRSKSILKKGIV